MTLSRSVAARVALLAASSISALVIGSPANAATRASPWDDANRVSASDAFHDMVRGALTPTLHIVTNDGPDIHPLDEPANNIAVRYANSADVLDTSGVNGVGQMIALEFPFLGLCTGTLINPRTVITAAHCVYGAPKEYYGSETGLAGGVPSGQGLPGSKGIPISFGFEPTNRCRGVAVNGCVANTGPYETWRDSGYQTQVDKHIYNGNQVWYARESQPVALGGGGEFGNKDIAIVTLDTHVENVPTWTLLFSPLTQSTHVTITGYGAAGVGTTGIGDAAGIDYRRRSAENMIDALMSSADWLHTTAVGGPGGFHGFDDEAHSLYWMDFDDPAYDPENPDPADDSFVFATNEELSEHPENYNWNQNNLGGGALPREGTTAGGDSGGPLIVDQTFTDGNGHFVPVVAGVLTGGWSSNGGIGTYGENAVYPPLFLYWQDIVANNPYKYVSAKAGDGDWFDASHWIQDMDPHYAVIGDDGQLVNSLPNVSQVNQDSTAGRFGTSCFFEELCEDIVGTPYPTGTGGYIVTAGGPGTTNFVPNNVEPNNNLNPNVYRQAHYYDVTLRQAGTTTLSKVATIDQLTLDGGGARLNITSNGKLNVWSDFNQYSGWTNVDGKLTTGEALVASGILSGGGTLDPRFLTVVAGAVAPGGGGVGVLSVRSDVILASASGLLIDIMRGSADQLKVFGDTEGAGVLALDGGSLLLTQVPGAALARAGEKFQIATAQGGVDGTFGSVGLSSPSVLNPLVAYDATKITVTLQAGSFAAMLKGSNPTTLAFANALDALRGSHYNQLSNFYGNIDWMSGSQLAATFNAISPAAMIGETRIMQDRQSRQLLGNVSDRLSLLGTGRAHGISFNGNAAALSPYRSDVSVGAQLGLSSGGQSVALPSAEGLSGFVAMSSDHVASSYGDQRALDAGQFNRYFATGVEAPMGDAMVGTAIGYAESISRAGSDEAKSKMAQAAAYASMPVGKHAYVGGLIAAERSSTDVNRLTTDTMSAFSLTGGTHAARYSANVEAGFVMGLAKGLSFTPRAQVGVSHYSLGGFRESGGETALDLDTLKVNRIEARLGARLDGATKLGAWTLRPQVQADYVRLVSGRNNGLTVAFAAAPEYSFALPLTNGGSGWMEAKGGVELTKGAFSFGLSGQATVGDAPLTDQRGMAEFKFSF